MTLIHFTHLVVYLCDEIIHVKKIMEQYTASKYRLVWKGGLISKCLVRWEGSWASKYRLVWEGGWISKCLVRWGGRGVVGPPSMVSVGRKGSKNILYTNKLYYLRAQPNINIRPYIIYGIYVLYLNYIFIKFLFGCMCV